ncbi:exotoxin [Gibbsiella quercinecans]|uniref:fimbrial protein n=1 Tax=Gibbsiella quercinecans TaxID=929813 RepID=UPI000EF25D9F|nr:fimbrial protein [Gibbsiella quercinecans]RLM04388.1 exotoxin [Gibbsiella quercinecans]
MLMIKKKPQGVALLAAMLLAASGHAAAANGENMYFHGTLVAEPCVIPPGEEEIALDFGTIVDKYLYLNTRTLSRPFTLHLTECDTSLGNTVTVTFSGTENSHLPGLLAIDSGSAASGIAVGLETQDGQALQLNKATSKYQLTDGSNTISLQAYVQGEPDAITNKTIGRGTFSAVATFSLAYE